MKIIGKNPVEPLSKKWASRKDFLDELGKGLVQEVHNRIANTKSAPDGTRWKPWASSTAKARRRAGTSASGLLFNTGTLANSTEYEVIGDKVVVRNTQSYAQYLQNGTRNMPARPFLGMGKAEETLTKNLWKKWIES